MLLPNTSFYRKVVNQQHAPVDRSSRLCSSASLTPPPLSEKERAGGQETMPGSYASRHFLLGSPVAQRRPQVDRQADGKRQPDWAGKAKCRGIKRLPDACEPRQERGQEE